jgi:SAM-dependent methyltransferase
MNPNQAVWDKGDFSRIAETYRQSGADIVGRLGITPGMAVLDLGCGDGTTAIPAAKLGADVLGVDLTPKLVEAGNRRAKELGLSNCRFEEGDATNLAGLKDHSFDLVVSVFGAMFAPKPFDVAREMVRVTKPGGRIVMGNWIPGDPTLVAQLLKICTAYSPPPPPPPPPPPTTPPPPPRADHAAAIRPASRPAATAAASRSTTCRSRSGQTASPPTRLRFAAAARKSLDSPVTQHSSRAPALTVAAAIPARSSDGHRPPHPRPQK